MATSLRNTLLSGTKGAPKPEVGMGCTILMYSDRYAGTIVSVADNGKMVAMQRDKAERVDDNGMSESQQYKYMPNPEADIRYFTLRKNGAFVEMGKDLHSGTQLRIGDRKQYRDYSY